MGVPVGVGLLKMKKLPGPSSRKRRPAGQTAELAILARLRTRIQAKGPGSNRGGGVHLGIGDDCALLRVKPDELIAVTTDLSIEGRHFELAWHPAESIGHRVLARGLSDLAAMGARPVASFLSLGLPRGLVGEGRKSGSSKTWHREPWIDRFYDGLLALACEFNTPLAGGDLAESPIALADIVLVGAVPVGGALMRSGARAGDSIYVTGALGGAAAGLEHLRSLAASQNPTGGSKLRIPNSSARLLAKHLYPQPRVRQGLWLAKRGAATAAIDVSDGLSTDLAHLCDESGVAAEIDVGSLPISPGSTISQAVHGGEDYELLFTARPAARIPRKIAGVPVTCIGRMVKRSPKRPMVTLVTPEGREPLEAEGWEHFA